MKINITVKRTPEVTFQDLEIGDIYKMKNHDGTAFVKCTLDSAKSLGGKGEPFVVYPGAEISRAVSVDVTF